MTNEFKELVTYLQNEQINCNLKNSYQIRIIQNTFYCVNIKYCTLFSSLPLVVRSTLLMYLKKQY